MVGRMHAESLKVEEARFNMVEQQIRPWEVLAPGVLDLLMRIKRENFVPPAYRSIAFADLEIPLAAPTGGDASLTPRMWAPKVEAKVLQALDLEKDERVLEIGTGSGFMAALMAALAGEVVSVEIDSALAASARKNLAAADVGNVRVEVGCGAKGWPAGAPYDAIVITGAVEAVPVEMLRQLKVGGRLVAIVGSFPVWNAELITQTAEGIYSTVKLFETAAVPLRNIKPLPTFSF